MSEMSLKNISREVLSKRDPHPEFEDFWCDGQIRLTPMDWLLNGEHCDKMKVCDAARILLRGGYQITQVVGARILGKIDEIVIRFSEFTPEEHKVRLEDDKIYFEDRMGANAGKCRAQTYFRLDGGCCPQKLVKGENIPPRILWVECCSASECDQWQSGDLHDLDMLYVYPNNPDGIKISIIQSDTGKYSEKCLHNLMEFCKLEGRKISCLNLYGFKDFETLKSYLKSWHIAFLAFLLKEEKLEFYTEYSFPEIDNACYKCIAEKFTNMHSKHEINEIGKHLAGKNEGGHYVEPIYGDISKPVKKCWYERPHYYC